VTDAQPNLSTPRAGGKIVYRKRELSGVLRVLFQSKALLAAAALLSLCACGRRGDLEPPTAAVAPQVSASGHGLDVHRADTKIKPPKKDFVLDPLLR